MGADTKCKQCCIQAGWIEGDNSQGKSHSALTPVHPISLCPAARLEQGGGVQGVTVILGLSEGIRWKITPAHNP